MGTVRESLRTVAGLFYARPQPHRDAQELLCHVLNFSRTELLLELNNRINPESEEKLMESATRIAGGKPLEYEIGHCTFLGLKIEVNPFVLIPRPDTELLVQEALKVAKNGDRVLDLCTGSSCIAIALKKMNPYIDVTASDISQDALDVATGNARLNGVEMEFINSDLFGSIEGQFDVIVSNPPYIPTSRIPDLEKEISFEPLKALDGGTDGLDFYRRISNELPKRLKAGGVALFEIDCPQKLELLSLVAVFKDFATNIINDLSDRPRVLIARKP